MINQLLNDYSITKDRIYGLLNSLSETGSDYSDLYFQHSIAESWLLDEGIVKDGSYSISHGAGVRCVKGDKTGFSYSDDLILKQSKVPLILQKEYLITLKVKTQTLLRVEIILLSILL